MRSLAFVFALLGLSTAVLADDPAPAPAGEEALNPCAAPPSCDGLEGEALTTCQAAQPAQPAQPGADDGKSGKAKGLKAKGTGNMEDFGTQE